MIHRIAAAAIATLIAAPAVAQTTNVACLNDYYVTLGGLRYPAVGTPCTAAASLPVPPGFALALSVDSGFAPGSLVVPFFALGPCAPKSLCLAPIACPIPPAGAPCFSNQSGDLAAPFAGPTGFTLPGPCPSSASITLALPAGPIFTGITFSTQAVILPLGPSCAMPPGFAVTEAFNFTL